MPEYIERDTAIKALMNDAPEQVSYSREDAADCIRYMDAADVVPVRHGRWIETPRLYYGAKQYECSLCCSDTFWNKHSITEKYPRCPQLRVHDGFGGLNMTHEDFKTCLEELDGQGAKTLVEKNARYSSSDDALHNFKMGAEVMGGTPAQACWGYMTKHLVALRDMIQRNDFHNREDVLEKIQDSINYLRFIWAISEEERSKYCKGCETDG